MQIKIKNKIDDITVFNFVAKVRSTTVMLLGLSYFIE